MKYRLVVLPLRKPRGPWRDSREEAIEDAIKAGLAERGEFNERHVWWHPLAEIEERDD